MLRLFVAWPLPEGVGREIGRMTKELRAELPPASWPRPESIHLTFAFLGDTSEERASTIASALDSVACAAIPIRLGGVGVFPDERRPRVVWLGVDPAPPVVVLAGEIRRALAGVGATFDPKPFRPHLTVARIKAPWRAADVGALRAAFEGWASPEASLDRVVLYSSRLSPHGAVHSEVHAVVLEK